MYTKTLLTLILASVQLLYATPVPQDGSVATGLHSLAKAKGRFFGTAIGLNELNNAATKAILSNNAEFGWLVAENQMKWMATERTRNQFTFEAADKIANFSEANGQNMRCHTLVWDSFLPDWVRARKANQKEDRAEAIEIMKNHIRKVMTHFKGQCKQWDVVNEALLENGQVNKQATFYKRIGPDYIEIAFKAAREADPDAKLYYNDFSIERPNDKSTGAQNLIRDLNKYSRLVDRIGLQAHFGIRGPSFQTQKTNLAAFAALNVDIAYTELDVGIPVQATPQERQQHLEQQAAVYENTAAACMATPRCTGIMLWTFTDKYNWKTERVDPVQDVFMATPWTTDFKKKPQVYNAIVAGLK